MLSANSYTVVRPAGLPDVDGLAVMVAELAHSWLAILPHQDDERSTLLPNLGIGGCNQSLAVYNF